MEVLVAVTAEVFVAVGAPKGVLVGRLVIVGVGGTGVGVKVARPAWTVAWASAGLTGVISPGEQYWPLMLQANLSSSLESGAGVEGGLIASDPPGPPSWTLTCWPAPKYCCWPWETILPAPLYRLTCIFPFLAALRLALPVRVNSVPLTVNCMPCPLAMEIMMPSRLILLHTI
jgi:hypothetical protein